MRVLFTSMAFPGHYLPLVPLGWALRAAGHDVRVAVEPGFAPVVTRSGLTAAPVGEDVNLQEIWRGVGVEPDAATTPEDHRRRRLERSRGMYVAAARAALPDLLELARQFRPDLVVYEPRAYAGAIAGQLRHIPAIRHLWGPDFTWLHRAAEEEFLSALWSSYGLADAAHLGALTIDPCPASVQVPVSLPLLPMRYVPYNGAGSPQGWLDHSARRPRICVTWGTTFSKAASHLAPARRAIEAARRHGAEVIAVVAAADAAVLGTVGGNIRVAESLPLHLLLPSCDLLVHQGGAGTTLTALTCGVPQVIVPYIADTFLNADSVQACGAGLAIPLDQADDGALDAAVSRVLADPSFAGAARRVADENARRPAPASVAAALLDQADRD